MRSFGLILFLALITIGCSNDPRAKLPTSGAFGEVFTISDAVIPAETINLNDSIIFGIKQISGTIEKYCKGEGCWFTIKQTNGNYILVDLEEKKYVLPMNIDGKEVIANGYFVESKNPQKPEPSFVAKGIQIK
jgi:hypothetical protein